MACVRTTDTPSMVLVDHDRLDKMQHDANTSPHKRGFQLKGLPNLPHRIRTNDDIHRSIKLCAVTATILDTPQMQRLRGLKQLGISELTYMTTTHSRFEHSLGVAHLAEAMLNNIRQNQPKLNITDKDLLCVKIAGLCHDLGHGPFSHVYDGEFRRLLRMAQEKGVWLGQPLDLQMYQDQPSILQGWAHEDASLMMVDALLAHLGLRINVHKLDAPLKQIGHGIHAHWFGICEYLAVDDRSYTGREVLPLHRVLTSRDWMFIKECIVGGPLPEHGHSIHSMGLTNKVQELIGMPDPCKEFLYDIVSNRHSGLDVDRLDYLARDGRRACITAGEINPMMIENAVVAWGYCSRPNTCFRCQHRTKFPIIDTGQTHPTTTPQEGMHLMICYPHKMVDNVMNFFKNRFRNHHELYTHKTSKAAEFMTCDILVLADAHFRISTLDEGDGTASHNHISPCNSKTSKSTGLPLTERLVISRAMTNPNAYLKLKDSILDLIAHTTSKELLKARQLIQRLQARRLYKLVGELNMSSITDDGGTKIDTPYHCRIWDMSEQDIMHTIVSCSKLIKNTPGDTDSVSFELLEDDICVEKRSIHHGMGTGDPVSCVRFLHKSQMTKLLESPMDLPVATHMSAMEYWGFMPRALQTRTLRVFCRAYGKEDFLTTCFYQFLEYMQKSVAVLGPSVKVVENGNGSRASRSVAILSQDSPSFSSINTHGLDSTTKRPQRTTSILTCTPNEHDTDNSPCKPKKKHPRKLQWM